MDYIKLRIAILLTLLIFSCCEDKPGVLNMVLTCESENWVGVYSGHEECEEETPDFMTIERTLSEGDNSDEFIYQGNTVSFIDCEAEVMLIDSINNYPRTISFTLLPGDSILIKNTITIPSIGDLSCRFWGGK